MSADSLPQGTLIAFYGDDFTGSSSVLEVLSSAGLETVMFLDIPRPDQLARFAHCRCVGIAGVARSRSPEWMDRALPPIYSALAALDAPVTHYKTCSTFDSAPHIGSIGRAIELAQPYFSGWHPLFVAAPAIGRYQVFGNLFAAVSGVAHRLDRHPVMARHPVTPMDEADVRLHLSKQTALAVGLVDLVALKSGRGGDALAAECAAGKRIIALDTVDEETLAAAGQLIWQMRDQRIFAAGSQGVEYALVAYWRAAGLLPHAVGLPAASPVDRVACVSGSVSPITAEQITHAAANGFALVRLNAVCALDPQLWQAELDKAAALALKALGEGRDSLVLTASGPDDAAVHAFSAAIAAHGAEVSAVNDRIGNGLGRLLDRIMREGRIQRGIISGGDTSGHAVMAMGAFALTATAALQPGAPLCRVHADDLACDGREIVMKGGQMGGPDFFSAARNGSNA